MRPTAGLGQIADLQFAEREDALTLGAAIANQAQPGLPDVPRPSSNMLGKMTALISPAELLEGDISRHFPLMAQYQRVTF